MAFRHDGTEDIEEVVLRVPDETGTIDMTNRETLEPETHDLVFARDANGGIGQLKHWHAFVTRVVPLGDNQYRLEDVWHGHPFRMNDKEETRGGLAFRDVFLAQRLTDGSLRFEGIVRKGDWRVLHWFLGHYLLSPHLERAFARIEEHGGFATEDPWIGGGWLWIFLPPKTDYDPTKDVDEVIKAIPREEILSDFERWRKRWPALDAGPTSGK
jgi:hypothetical protein